jgi:diketogulonate reductase-like aldo/keto reductase
VNWVRQRTPGVIVPILGARKLAQLKDNLGCLEFEIPADHMARLEEASRIDTGFPQDFLGRDNIRRLYLGDTKDRILAR